MHEEVGATRSILAICDLFLSYAFRRVTSERTSSLLLDGNAAGCGAPGSSRFLSGSAWHCFAYKTRLDLATHTILSPSCASSHGPGRRCPGETPSQSERQDAGQGDFTALQVVDIQPMDRGGHFQHRPCQARQLTLTLQSSTKNVKRPGPPSAGGGRKAAGSNRLVLALGSLGVVLAFLGYRFYPTVSSLAGAMHEIL